MPEELTLEAETEFIAAVIEQICAEMRPKRRVAFLDGLRRRMDRRVREAAAIPIESPKNGARRLAARTEARAALLAVMPELMAPP